MQSTTAAPRNNQQDSQIRALITDSDTVEVNYGCEWFGFNLQYLGDVSRWMNTGSKIDFDSTADVNASCTLVFDSDAPFNFMQDYLKPYMVLTDRKTGFRSKFYLGFYTLTSPEVQETVNNQQSISYTGYDILYLLNQPIGQSVSVYAGDSVFVSINNVVRNNFSYFPIVLSGSDKTFPTALSWPFPNGSSNTYLSIINDMLDGIGFTKIWADWEGTLHAAPYVRAKDLNSEWTFDAGNKNSIIGSDMKISLDSWGVPNWWRFTRGANSDESAAATTDEQRAALLTPVEGTTMYTFIDTDISNPSSYANRKVFFKSCSTTSASDYPAMVALAKKTIDKDLASTETFVIRTSPLPLLWREDQATFLDARLATIKPRLASTRRIQSKSWSLPLDVEGGDMTSTWVTIPS